MFRKSDDFVLLPLMIRFLVSACLWFALQNRERAIFTASWIPSMSGSGVDFEPTAAMGRRQ
jgi:hypothetical protein